VKIEKKGNEFLVTLTKEEARQVYQCMSLKKMMGNLLGPGLDILQDIGFNVAVEVQRAAKRAKETK